MLAARSTVELGGSGNASRGRLEVGLRRAFKEAVERARMYDAAWRLD